MPLSNATQLVLATQYYDDYYAASNTPGETQGQVDDFQRILFNPKRAVQARELTQAQTLLQVQMAQFASGEYHDGDAITGGQLTLDTSVISGQVLPTTNLVALFNIANNTGQFVFDTSTPTTKAHILQFVSADQGTVTNNYIIFKPQTATAFLPGDVIQSTVDPTITATFSAGNVSSVFSPASIVSINDSVFFVEGFFVSVPAQTIVLNPFSQFPSYRVGLDISENIITELSPIYGPSLLDPANQNAVGADRLQIVLTLDYRPLTTSADAGFIELMRVINGQVVQSKKTPQFVRVDALNSILAGRTYDELGNFFTTPFPPVLADNPADANTFLLSLGPGGAFVRGYEITTAEVTNIVVPKARTTANANNRSIPLPVGNYVYAVRPAASEPIDYFANTTIVDVHTVNVASINTASNIVYNYSRIGQAYIRMLEPFEVPNLPALYANNTIYKLFFYGIQGLSLTGNVVSSSVNNSVAITCVLPVANGTPAVNGAIVGATIVLSGNSSPVTGAFTVNNYIVTGGNAYVTLVEYLPTLPNNNTAYQLIFTSNNIDSFALFDAGITLDAPYASNLSFQADVAIDSKVGNLPTGFTLVSDTTDAMLLYQIPETFVVANSISADTAVFDSWLSTSANAIAFAGNANAAFTITLSGANFSLPEGSLSAETAAEYFLIFDQTVDQYGGGVVIQFEDTPGPTDVCLSNVVVTAIGVNYNIAFTYNFGTDTATTRSLIGLAKAIVSGYPVRQKTLILANTTAVQSNTTNAQSAGQIEFYALNAASGFGYSLKTTDVFSIQQVLYKTANTPFTNADLTTAADVTDIFTLDNGQRDNTYEYAQLIVGPSASAFIATTGRLLVFFNWFRNSGRGYATVDSYVNATNAAQGLTYDEVQNYTSVAFGVTTSLRDVLDFRPVRSTSNFTASALVYAANDVSSNTTYLTSASVSYLIPTSDGVWFGNYEYYLARVDNIGLTYDGTFHVTAGVDSLTPVPPVDVSNDLLLFQLSIPQYTLVNANGVPTTVLLQTFSHKRYQMSDIAALDTRITHLEYYVALNSLEALTANTPILDSNQVERFKNGILVDNFQSGTTADSGRSDFTASLDTANGELRTAYNDFVIQFAPDIANSTSVGVVLVGDMAILSYNTTPWIVQSLATDSLSVNPFDVASFYGVMSLSPAVDIWQDTINAPAQVVDLGGPTAAWVAANTPEFVNWGAWDQTYNGVVSSSPVTAYSTPPGWTGSNHPVDSEAEITFNNVTTSTTYSQTGTAYSYVSIPTTTSLGNQVINTSIIPFCRQRDIIFDATGVKPGSNLFAFFGGTLVQNYIQRADILQLAEQVGNTNPFSIGQSLYVLKATTGLIAVTNGNNTIVGTNTFFTYELVVGQQLQIQQGSNVFFSGIAQILSDTSAILEGQWLASPPSFNPTPTVSLANATLYTLTPVSVADVASFITGNTVQYTVKVVRAVRDADVDMVVPYAITAGCLRPDKMVKDTANTTTGASLVFPSIGQPAPYAITSAVCVSGIVRSYNNLTGAVRFDLDIFNAAVSTPGTIVYFVSGDGAGSSGNIVSYNAAIQTAILDTTSLLIDTTTTYSVGQPVADGFIANNVTSGRAGTIAGVFHLQNGTFATGTQLFEVTDSPTNNTASATTTAETNYQASGLSVTDQSVSVTSRTLGIVATGVAQQSITVQDTTVNGFTTQYIDPLAETFLVDPQAYPQGVFIVSVDICFASAPTDDIPVTLEIRPVVNGYPSSNQLIPCVGPSNMCTVTLRPDAVNVSAAPDLTNAATFTTFTFDAPTMLMPGQQYAIVIRSDSDLYEVYVAVLGDTVIGSDAKVAKQPYAGSFFESQNASTWVPDPLQDLMFRINRAIWTGANTAPQTGILVARGVAPVANVFFDSYEFYPHEVQFGGYTSTGYTIDVKPENLVTQDLTGEIAIRYEVIPNVWSILSERSMVQGYGGSIAANTVGSGAPFPLSGPSITPANTVDALCTLNTFSPDVAPYIDLQKFDLLCIQHLINNMGLSNTDVVVLNPGAGYLVNVQVGTVSTVGGSPIVTGNNNANFSVSVTAGDSVVIGGNTTIIVSVVTDNTHFIATANLAVTVAANDFYTFGALGGNNTIALTITDPGTGTGANGYAVVTRAGIISGVIFTSNGQNYTDTPIFTVVAPVAPGGDWTLTQTTALLGFNSEISPMGGNGLTRYITKPVTLASGFDATDIMVTFDAYGPLTANFWVYYAVLPTGSTQPFSQQNWRPLVSNTANGTFSTGYFNYQEYNFVTPTGQALALPGDTSTTFGVFALKLVMASSSFTDCPRLENFRAIALDD